MPTKQIDRLMFAQGGKCFFCEKVLPKAEASVEHLVASSNGGSNSDENCVVCCKAVNALLGSMSLKEKLRVALNQKGNFKCPNGAASAKSKTKSASPSKSPITEAQISQVVNNLKQRGHARPRRLKTLKSTIESELGEIVESLSSMGKVVIDGNNVSYKL
jgi:hypothetical protein